MRIALYVSGHGYGHATRMAELIRELLERRPDLQIAVRTAAPAFLFPADVEVLHADFEPGLAESRDSLRILAEETAHRVVAFLERADALVAREADWLRSRNIRLVVADIPFLAGEIAAAAGVSCVGISNFTWDWIYEPHLRSDPRWPAWEARIQSGYSRFAALLRMPFAQPVRMDAFRRIVDVPLIGRRGTALPWPDHRPRVLVGMRAAVDRAVVQRASEQCPEFVFVEPNHGPRFQDLLASSALVVAKLGFSTVAECVANRTPLLHAPREGFREDAISRVEAARYINFSELPLDHFAAGNWGEHIRRLAAMPMPAEIANTGGAAVCAEWIEQLLTRG